MRVLVLSLSGVLSGVITSALLYPTGRLNFYILGGVFGLSMAIALAVCGILRVTGRTVLLPVAAAIIFYLSFCVAGIVGLALAGDWTMGKPSAVSPFAMLVGGMLGGFLVLALFLITLTSGIPNRKLLVVALAWCPVGGILGVIGWRLGPTFGVAVWSALHSLGLTPPTETIRNVINSQTSDTYSLFVVWQGGMALVLGILLGRLHPKPYRTRFSMTLESK